MSYWELLKLTLPQVVVVIAALGVILVDFAALREQPARLRMTLVGAFAAVGCAAAIVVLLAGDLHGRLPEGMLVADSLTRLAQVALLVLSLFTILISADSEFTDHAGEFYCLALLATAGLMFLAATENLLVIFASLELASLSLYILAAFDKRNPRSAEAALKYFLFGGMSAAFTLFGLSLVYGLTGKLDLAGVAARLQTQELSPLLLLALVMTLIGFGFKIAVVPFHLWAPDAYQGAPAASAALVASGSKLASFFVLGKLVLLGFAGLEGSAGWRNFAAGWMPLLAVLAVLSLMLGNLAAIAQSNVRRLLAYSAIGHAGYAVLAVLAANHQGFSALLYYLITYGLTLIGAFAVVEMVERHSGGSQMEHFNGLARRSPVLALCLLVFLLSLAGIPPLAGFFGKFYVFTAAANSAGRELGLLWLVILGIALSAVSLYYYLQVLKRVYVAEAPTEADRIQWVSVPGMAIILLAALLMLLGCLPDWLVSRLLDALAASGLPA